MKVYWKWGLGLSVLLVGIPAAIYFGRLHQARQFLEEQKRAIVAAGYSLDPESMNETTVTPAQNAAPAYRKIYAKYYADIAKLTGALNDKKYAEVDRRVVMLKPAIQESIAASKLPGYFVKRDYARGYNLELPEFSQFRQVGRLLEIAAESEASRGDDRQALEYLEACRRMANHVGSDWTIIAQQVSRTIRYYRLVAAELAVRTKDPAVKARCEALVRETNALDHRRWFQPELYSFVWLSENPAALQDVLTWDSADNLNWLDRMWASSEVNRKEVAALAIQRLLFKDEEVKRTSVIQAIIRAKPEATITGRLNSRAVAQGLTRTYYGDALAGSEGWIQAAALAIGATVDRKNPMTGEDFVPKTVNGVRRWCHGESTRGRCVSVEGGRLRTSNGDGIPLQAQIWERGKP